MTAIGQSVVYLKKYFSTGFSTVLRVFSTSVFYLYWGYLAVAWMTAWYIYNCSLLHLYWKIAETRLELQPISRESDMFFSQIEAKMLFCILSPTYGKKLVTSDGGIHALLLPYVFFHNIWHSFLRHKHLLRFIGKLELEPAVSVSLFKRTVDSAPSSLTMNLILFCFSIITCIHFTHGHIPWGCYMWAGLDNDPEPPNIPPLITTTDTDNDWVYPEYEHISRGLCPPHTSYYHTKLLRINPGESVNLACPGTRFANNRLRDRGPFLTAT